jgi:hypothetical protein
MSIWMQTCGTWDLVFVEYVLCARHHFKCVTYIFPHLILALLQETRTIIIPFYR